MPPRPARSATQSPTGAPPERLGGVVERVTFHSAESGFCVLQVAVRGRRELVAVTGVAAHINPGESIEALGFWANDPQYGLQFRAQNLQTIQPTTLEGIQKYLASGMVPGIGPRYAERLVTTFGADVFTIIETSPQRLHEVEGIGPKRAERITAAWAEHRAVREIMVFLQSHGVGTARAVRIHKTYGDAAIATVTANPYRLALDIYGIGFKTADALALRLGIPQDSVLRAQAGLRHVLQELADNGHCACSERELIDRSAGLLGIPETTLQTALSDEQAEARLIAYTDNGQTQIALAALYHAEVGVARQLERLMQGLLPWGAIDSARAIPWVETQTQRVLSASQRAAVQLALSHKIILITGGPGVGKTTLIQSLLRIVQAKGLITLLCAPTGRAAKRLNDTTGLPAKTLHRTLEFDPKSQRFQRNKDQPLDADLVVLDETSMVDVVMMHKLLSAIPSRAAVWMVGDPDQLPSVGPGAVLADILASGLVPTVRLTEIFRQAASSQIIVNAYRVQQGHLPRTLPRGSASDFHILPAETPEVIQDLLLRTITDRLPRHLGIASRDIQVLTPMQRGSLGAAALNVLLQERLNPDPLTKVTRFGVTYAPGDKIMQLVNNYDKEVFNGDIGVVDTIDLDSSVLTMRLDERLIAYDFSELDELTLAYATSIHKSQGSEYPAVIIPLALQHYTLLERNLLYTAITRGKRMVVIIGQPRALALAVKNHRAQLRVTGLTARLFGK